MNSYCVDRIGLPRGAAFALAANLEKVATPELQEKYKELVGEESGLLEKR